MSLPILGFVAGFLGFGAFGLHAFERSAARDIRLGLQGDHVEVKVRTSVDLGVLNGDLLKVTIEGRNFATQGLPLFTEPDRPKDGTLRSLHLVLHDFTLRGMHLEELVATIPDCRFDLGLAVRKRQIRLSQSGVGMGSVRIRDRDLEAFILAKFHEFQRASVKIQDGRLHVEGHGVFLFFDTDFSVDGRLEPLDGTRLSLVDAHISFGGQPPDATAQRALLDTLNPVVDLNKDLDLHDALKLDHVTLEDGYLLASGATTIPVKG